MHSKDEDIHAHFKTYHYVGLEKCNTYLSIFDNRNFVGNNCNFNNKRTTSYCAINLYGNLALFEMILNIWNC